MRLNASIEAAGAGDAGSGVQKSRLGKQAYILCTLTGVKDAVPAS